MKRYEIIHALARRLGLKVGRAQAILSKLQDDGVVSSSGYSKRCPDDMAEPEIVSLLIALISESGISSATSAAKTFGDLTTAEGQRFDRFIEELIFGPPGVLRHIIVRQNPAGVSITANGEHLLFGAPSSPSTASPARIVPGEALVAIAAELRGATPAQADAEAALGQLARALQ